MAEDDLDRRVLAARAEASAASSEWPYKLADEVLAAEPSRAARELPIAGYDDLSLPSLRARLRNLDVAQLRQLVLYEISHAYRPDVVTMFERRIAKLEDAGDA